MRPIKTRDIEYELKRRGFLFERQSGSHLIYKNHAGYSVVIVNTREQSNGTIRSINRQLESAIL